MTTSPFDPTYRTAVSSRIADFAAGQRAFLAATDPLAADLADTALDFTTGGKMLRPVFCHAGWLVAGGAPGAAAPIGAGAAFEWLQASALVHDDLMDGSDTRRGRPSVHRDFEQRHRTAGGAGESVQFGSRVAILLGDLLLSWADQTFATAAPDARTAELWSSCKSEVIAGQYLDVLAQTRSVLSVEDAMRVVRFKAAKYTVERPVQIGAALAGADADLIAGLSRFALPLGEAFQLRDDVLGVFGDPAETGKPSGDDLREGKRTVLVARTAEAVGDEQVLALLGREEGVDRLRDLIASSGAREAVEHDIDRLSHEALDAAEALGGSATEILSPLVDAAIRRDR